MIREIKEADESTSLGCFYYVGVIDMSNYKEIEIVDTLSKKLVF